METKFDKKLYNLIKNISIENKYYFKINICVYSQDKSTVCIYNLAYEFVKGELHIFNLKTPFDSFSACRNDLIMAINDLCTKIKKDFCYQNPYDVVKVGSVFN